MQDHENREIQEQIIIDRKGYTLVLERERGVGLYASADRSEYLRIGSKAATAKELGFHKRLLQAGFPVARILKEGEFGETAYWVEESLGFEHLGNMFAQDTSETGEIREDTFQVWLWQVVNLKSAQERTSKMHTYNQADLAIAVGEAGMKEELSEMQPTIRAAWEKAMQNLRDVPQCLTHGDFTPHNTMERGIIDFGDHFEGPLGYDLVTAITVPFWFPEDRSYEFFQKSRFNRAQVEQFFEQCNVLKIPGGTLYLSDIFDDLFWLKGNWWSVKNYRMPKLQEWRYGRYKEITKKYLAGESLLDYWLNTCP
jgi:hypothetical protein